MAGVALVSFLVGLALIAAGGVLSRNAVKERFGELTAESIEAAEDEGLVRWWVSAMVLVGWAAALGGIGLAVWGAVFG